MHSPLPFPRAGRIVAALACLVLAALAPRTHAAPPEPWNAADLYASPTPYVQGHRGDGADAFDPLGPGENTLAAFQKAFGGGVRVVELDLQRTADGKVVVFHDDFLSDGTCVGSLTYDQLLVRHPDVPQFRTVLNALRHFGYTDCLDGAIFAEIKVPVPLCDGANTSAQAEVSESALVAAVVSEIRQARMEPRVILNAGSPSILRHAAEQAPEIRRSLTLNALQLLPPEQVCGLLGPEFCPVLIPKNDCGLDWYNIGPIARLPRFTSFQQYVATTLGCAQATGVSLDRIVLLQAGAGAPALVAMLHGLGLEVVVWTVDDSTEFDWLAAAGVDGITSNAVAMGLRHQSAPTCAGTGALAARSTERVLSLDPATPRGVSGGFSLAAAHSPVSPDGGVRVEFALPDAGPATMTLHDVAGRRLAAREVGSFGAGRHETSLGDHLAPGVYFVRLSHPSGEARTKVAFLR